AALGGIKRGMAGDDPSHVTRARLTQGERRRILRRGRTRRFDQLLDLAHGIDHLPLRGRRQRGEQGGGFRLALAVNRREGASPFGSQRDETLPRIGGGALPAYQPVAAEAGENARNIAG